MSALTFTGSGRLMARALRSAVMMLAVVAGASGARLALAAGVTEWPLVVSKPGNEVAREKVIYLFHHRDDWSRETFQRHYVETHAELGLRYTRNLVGYTVNLVKTQSHWDAVTEQWVPSREAILKRSENSASAEDFKKVTGDRISDSKMLTYFVKETLIRGERLTSPLFEPTPGYKVMWLYKPGTKIPEPPAWAYRIVDNRVLSKLEVADGSQEVWWKDVPSDVAVIRTAWTNDATAIRELANDAQALVVAEYRFRASPWN